MLDISILQGEARCELFEAKHESHLSNDDGQLSYDPFPYGTDYASRFHIKTMQVCAICLAKLELCMTHTFWPLQSTLQDCLQHFCCMSTFVESGAHGGIDTGSVTDVMVCRSTGTIVSASYQLSIRDGVTVPSSLSSIQMLSNGLWTCVAFEMWPFLCTQCK